MVLRTATNSQRVVPSSSPIAATAFSKRALPLAVLMGTVCLSLMGRV